jgi:hypothetical protein
MIQMRVCRYHGVQIKIKADAAGHLRSYCEKCKHFLRNNQITELSPQLFFILQHLNEIDEILGKIWGLAFHHSVFPKMNRGIPEHGLGDVFVAVHEAQRKILAWPNNKAPEGFHNVPDDSMDARAKRTIQEPLEEIKDKDLNEHYEGR